MRAAVMRSGRLEVDEIPDPVPQAGQVLVRTKACGICGSDLHALQHGDQMVALSKASSTSLGEGLPPTEIMDLARDVVMGHEFAAEVVELGENTGNCQVGDLVVSVPVALDAGGVHPVGYSNLYPGGYGELMVLNDLFCMKVPNGLEARRAALTEPMGVGLHAVNRAALDQRDAAVVLGCGPVGLAVIAALAVQGIEDVVAADYSPTRRALAERAGASEVVDPADESAMEAWYRVDGQRPVVIFEAVGVPGMIDRAMAEAPRHARVMVVGVCMEPDHLRPMLGVAKELTLGFSFGYDPVEFGETLRRIAEGEIDVDPLITGSVPLDGVPQAFTDLATPDTHAKILVEP
jgi:threonine dehydrogenase-like Zn-dependent dehydrogenase